MFLSLLFSKDGLYSAIIVGLLIGFGWFVHHERAIGAAHEAAAVNAATEALTKQNTVHNAEVLAAETKAVANLEDAFNAKLKDSDATAADVNRRLQLALTRRQSSGPAVPQAGSTAGQSDVAAGVPNSLADAIEGIVSAAGHDADKVVALQSFITNVCEK